MDLKIIKEYLDKGSLRVRSPDINRANSLINIAEITANRGAARKNSRVSGNAGSAAATNQTQTK